MNNELEQAAFDPTLPLVDTGEACPQCGDALTFGDELGDVVLCCKSCGFAVVY